jgi:hypothetical protein
MSNPLPVITLLNSARIISNFLYASQQVTLTSYITDNYPDLATEFKNWQVDIFDEYFEGFINYNLISQPSLIQQLYTEGVDPASIQTIAQSTLTPKGKVVPGLITSADNVSDLITRGGNFVAQLSAIAQEIKGADQKQVDALMDQANQLSAQFDEEEEKLVSDAFKLGTDIVITAVNIAIAVDSEGEDLQPVVKSISQVGSDVINEIDLKDDAKNTISQLQQTWALLDFETSALAQITLLLNQLNAVTQDTSGTFAALDSMVDDWQQVADLANVSAQDWQDYGNAAMQEWCSRMVMVSFAVATQTIASS